MAKLPTKHAGTTWKVVAAGTAMLAAMGARKVTEVAWRKTTGHPPPASPKHPDSTWPEALAFAMASGALVGAAKLVATRKAASGWRRMTGVLPPGVEKVV
jgi:hypothetical protein